MYVKSSPWFAARRYSTRLNEGFEMLEELNGDEAIVEDHPGEPIPSSFAHLMIQSRRLIRPYRDDNGPPQEKAHWRRRVLLTNNRRRVTLGICDVYRYCDVCGRLRANNKFINGICRVCDWRNREEVS